VQWSLGLSAAVVVVSAVALLVRETRQRGVARPASSPTLGD